MVLELARARLYRCIRLCVALATAGDAMRGMHGGALFVESPRYYIQLQAACCGAALLQLLAACLSSSPSFQQAAAAQQQAVPQPAVSGRVTARQRQRRAR